jgi:hypothetical protein
VPPAPAQLAKLMIDIATGQVEDKPDSRPGTLKLPIFVPALNEGD